MERANQVRNVRYVYVYSTYSKLLRTVVELLVQYWCSSTTHTTHVHVLANGEHEFESRRTKEEDDWSADSEDGDVRERTGSQQLGYRRLLHCFIS